MPYSKKRFLFVSHYDFNLWRFRLPLMRELIRRGAEVYAVCPSGEYSDRFAGENIRFIDWRCVRENRNLLREIAVIYKLRAIFQKIQPTVVHSYTIRPNLYSALASFISRRSWILIHHVTGMGSIYLDEGHPVKRGIAFLLDRIMRFSFSRSDRIIFQNRDDLELFVGREIATRPKTILITGSGVDCIRFHPVNASEKDFLRKSLLGDSIPVTVLFVARLIRHKGIFEFLEAAEVLKKKLGDRVRFMILGWFDRGNPSVLTEERLEEYTCRGVVEYRGFQETAPYYAASDIYCLPSYREGLPVSTMEAMACGLPVVTTDVPGCRETVEEGVNGFLVPSRNAEALAEALERLVVDGELRARMGKASLEKVRREFAVESIVEQHLALYERLLSGKPV